MSRRKDSCQSAEESAFRPKRLARLAAPHGDWRTRRGRTQRVVIMMPAGMFQQIHRLADRQCKLVPQFLCDLAYRHIEEQELAAKRAGGDEGLLNILRRP